MTLEQLLWTRFGTEAHPAEWDGRDGAGGKGSQRFWEYLWAIQQLSSVSLLSKPLSVIDIGGCNQFFAGLLRKAGVYVIVVDPLASGVASYSMTIEQYVHGNSATIMSQDAAVSISVLEHVENKQPFCEALDSFLCPIILTFEFGEGCVTQAMMYEVLSYFRNHHLTKMELCPVTDGQGQTSWRPMGLMLALNQ